MENPISLIELAKKAHRILNGNDNNGRTDFGITKGIIDKAFSNETNYKNEEDKIYTRLILIDTLYATQMSKRLYWLDDITNEIKQCNDDQLIKKCEKFLCSPAIDDPIGKLLTLTNIGIQKDGGKKGRATSLISKYLHFLMKGKFPIYDELAKNAYKLIAENEVKFKDLKIEPFSNPSEVDVVDYFTKMNELNKNSEIADYNKLDNLLWLIGKIDKGSFSSILGRKDYELLVEDPAKNLKEEKVKLKIEKEVKKSQTDVAGINPKKNDGKDNGKDINDFIKEYLQKSVGNLDYLGDDLKSFISFVLFDLKKE